MIQKWVQASGYDSLLPPLGLTDAHELGGLGSLGEARWERTVGSLPQIPSVTSVPRNWRCTSDTAIQDFTSPGPRVCVLDLDLTALLG